MGWRHYRLRADAEVGSRGSGHRCGGSSERTFHSLSTEQPSIDTIYFHPLPCSHPQSSLLSPLPPIHHQSPCAFMAAATLVKPAILLPATRLGYSPSFGSTYFLAVSSPLLKQFSMICLSLLSTSSIVHDIRCEFCAISSPDTATPPALAALPGWRLVEPEDKGRAGNGEIQWGALPGAYQIASPFLVLRCSSKVSMAS